VAFEHSPHVLRQYTERTTATSQRPALLSQAQLRFSSWHVALTGTVGARGANVVGTPVLLECGSAEEALEQLTSGNFSAAWQEDLFWANSFATPNAA